MPPVKIHLLPSHPAEGWASMNRYWEALGKCVHRQATPSFSFHCPLDPAGICTAKAGKLKLAFEKRIRYPLKVRLTVDDGIAHVLDHSYAFLLGSIPDRVKKIITVHDIIPLKEPEGLSSQSIARFRSRVEWIKKADLVLTDSESTQNDIVELLDFPREKSRILPLGADFSETETLAPLPEEVSSSYIFSIGGYMKRKNLEVLPKILEQIRLRHPHVKLVRAGGKLPASLVEDFHRRCGPSALVELGSVSEPMLAALYRSALVTVIPSFFEGFGLPVLEAMARGCPVVSSNTTSLPEVGGEAALYFDPKDVDAGARQILLLLDKAGNFRNDLIKKGLKRAQEFTWELHFQKLTAIYQEIASGLCPAS
jgi:glycosyltransferase involved in cell wall biosynthesis